MILPIEQVVSICCVILKIKEETLLNSKRAEIIICKHPIMALLIKYGFKQIEIFNVMQMKRQSIVMQNIQTTCVSWKGKRLNLSILQSYFVELYLKELSKDENLKTYFLVKYEKILYFCPKHGVKHRNFCFQCKKAIPLYPMFYQLNKFLNQ